MAKDLANKATVPVAVHLDHSASYEIAVSGIRDGFPSVMVDGSALPYEKNIEVTKAVVETASIFDVDVEAELGHVGNAQNLDDLTNTDHFTNVDKAVEFVERTGCGSLAIAVGNVTTSRNQIWILIVLKKSEGQFQFRWLCTDVPESLTNKCRKL